VEPRGERVSGELRIASFSLGPLATNGFIVSEGGSGSCVVIDPGEEAPRLLAALAEANLAPQAIWLTHAHFDHLGGVAGLRERHPVPVFLHPADRPLYEQASAMASAWGFSLHDPGVAFTPIHGGDRLHLGEVSFEVLHTPGHAPGHVAFYAPAAGVVFAGDLLFLDSIGRTDLPYADPLAMRESLEQLMVLPDATRVLVGHGPETTIGRERRKNPYIVNEFRGPR